MSFLKNELSLRSFASFHELIPLCCSLMGLIILRNPVHSIQEGRLITVGNEILPYPVLGLFFPLEG